MPPGTYSQKVKTVFLSALSRFLFTCLFFPLPPTRVILTQCCRVCIYTLMYMNLGLCWDVSQRYEYMNLYMKWVQNGLRLKLYLPRLMSRMKVTLIFLKTACLHLIQFFFLCGVVFSLMVTLTGNGISDLGSNPRWGCLHLT